MASHIAVGCIIVTRVDTVQMMVDAACLNGPKILGRNEYICSLDLAFNVRRIVKRFGGTDHIQVFFLTYQGAASMVRMTLPIVVRRRHKVGRPSRADKFEDATLGRRLANFILPQAGEEVQNRRASATTTVNRVRRRLLFAISNLVDSNEDPKVTNPNNRPLFSDRAGMALVAPVSRIVAKRGVSNLCLDRQVILSLPDAIVFVIVVRQTVDVREDTVAHDMSVCTSIMFRDPQVNTVPVVSGQI